MNYNDKLLNHYIATWGHRFQIFKWGQGPMREFDESFSVIKFTPTKSRKFWIYGTCGMAGRLDVNPMELHIFSFIEDDSLLELLTAVSYYHKRSVNLHLNDTVNFGRSWQGSSNCSFGFISLPYIDGRNLEIFKIFDNADVHCYWLVPITQDELNYKQMHGIENLEEKFEAHQFNYLDPNRSSVL